MAAERRNSRLLRRVIQAASLGLFLYLLVRAAGIAFPPPDLFLRLDPLTALAAPLAARAWIERLLPGLILLFAALFLGRVFCGYLCPFGITLDLVGWLTRRVRAVFKTRREPPPSSPRLRRMKYFLLAAALGGAAIGGNLFFWLAPIPLITRLYALLFHPLGVAAADRLLTFGRPFFEDRGWTDLAYAALPARALDSFWFLLIFFGLVFWLESRRPRFWCRFLCPAGALLALLSWRPRWRRRVGDQCIGCRICVRQCPTGAISDDGRRTRFAECVTCRTCVDVCPVRAVNFQFSKAAPTPTPVELEGEPRGSFLRLSRRAFLGSALSGAVLVLLQATVPGAAVRRRPGGRAHPVQLVRPPGTRPEADFLARCLRCGECIKVCPTNALAPAGWSTGPAPLFSPRLAARRGPCEPECNACGRVCPTGAILNLPLDEKRWAKMGTAKIHKRMCLAWAEDRRCVVCQEVCPYGALDLVQQPGNTAPVPVVDENRCYGCGYCEHDCPVAPSAIVVTSSGALRLDHGRYQTMARSLGLDLDPEARPREEPLTDDQLPPGFLELD